MANPFAPSARMPQINSAWVLQILIESSAGNALGGLRLRDPLMAWKKIQLKGPVDRDCDVPTTAGRALSPRTGADVEIGQSGP
jgi:hypothetical protein